RHRSGRGPPAPADPLRRRGPARLLGSLPGPRRTARGGRSGQNRFRRSVRGDRRRDRPLRGSAVVARIDSGVTVMGSLKVTPLTSYLGARVEGVDLSVGLGGVAAEEI